MTCKCVTVEYPSEKLITLIDAAIKYQKCELKFYEDRVKERTDKFTNLTWVKKLFSDNPDKGLLNKNWHDRWNCLSKRAALSELRSVRLCATKSDVVRITGECLDKIDRWAGR